MLCIYFSNSVYFFMYPAYSCHPGVLESLHFAVCICSGCDFIRHTDVSHCLGSPCNHVLLHPEILPSCITVRTQTCVILAIETSFAMHDGRIAKGLYFLRLVFVKGMALSEGEPNPMQTKCVVLQVHFVCSSFNQTSEAGAGSLSVMKVSLGSLDTREISLRPSSI